jgi:hypothetical protein
MAHNSYTYILFCFFFYITAVTGVCEPYASYTPVANYEDCVGSSLSVYGDSNRLQINGFAAPCKTNALVQRGFALPIQGPAYNDELLVYSVWLEESDTRCSIDLGYIDDFGGVVLLRNTSVLDQNGLIIDPATDLSLRAYKQWYTRSFVIPVDYVGRNVFAYFACTLSPGENSNVRRFYARNLRVQQSIFISTPIYNGPYSACGGYPTCPQACSVDLGVCNADDACSCSEGWGGPICDQPICSATCSPTSGYCIEPGECVCREGWSGADCTICKI